jgi:hypothetical protein
MVHAGALGCTWEQMRRAALCLFLIMGAAGCMGVQLLTCLLWNCSILTAPVHDMSSALVGAMLQRVRALTRSTLLT